MGLFQQRPEEQENEWTLPSEPLERTESEVLETSPTVDPLSLGMGLESGGSVTSIVFPVAAPPPAAVSAENREPEREPEPAPDAEAGAESEDGSGSEAEQD